MLLTNGSYQSRELYSPGFLSTICAILNMSHSVAPMGVAFISVRTRFAGLHRPDPNRDSVLLIAPESEVDAKSEEVKESIPPTIKTEPQSEPQVTISDL